MTLRLGILTFLALQSAQLTPSLCLVQITAPVSFLRRQRRLPIGNACKCCGSVCVVAPLSRHAVSRFQYEMAVRATCVYGAPRCAFPFSFPLLSCRKHALNCHRMKPALFSVLCEIKEKTGKFRLQSGCVYARIVSPGN